MNDFGSGPGMIPHTGSLNQTGGPGCLCRTCSLEKQISFLKARHDALRASHAKLLEALKNIWSMFDDGRIVRNITNDHKPDWALKMLTFAQELNKISVAIAAAEEIAKHV